MTPNYVTTEEFKTYAGSNSLVIPAGTFVKPIDVVYLPRHITSDPDRMRWFLPEKEDFCYTSYGIVIIPKHIIRKL